MVSVTVLSALSALAVLYAFRRNGAPQEIEGWQLGLLVMPWVFFGASSLPLVYLSWFGELGSGVHSVFLKGFFWVFAAMFICIIVAIYGFFVF